MKYTIDNNEIELLVEDEWIRIKTNSGVNLPFRNQTIKEIKETIEKNYHIVKDHYYQKVQDSITTKDLDLVSLRIVLYYFHIYNNWRTMYKREKNRDLTFLYKDFDHPSTWYEIINYFKKTYPDDYATKCQILLHLTPDKFQDLDTRKEQFDNMW